VYLTQKKNLGKTEVIQFIPKDKLNVPSCNPSVLGALVLLFVRKLILEYNTEAIID